MGGESRGSPSPPLPPIKGGTEEIRGSRGDPGVPGRAGRRSGGPGAMAPPRDPNPCRGGDTAGFRGSLRNWGCPLSGMGVPSPSQQSGCSGGFSVAEGIGVP